MSEAPFREIRHLFPGEKLEPNLYRMELVEVNPYRPYPANGTRG